MKESKGPHIVILLYWSLKDPLCEGLMLDYLKRLDLENYTFHLITFEQNKYKLSLEDERSAKGDLQKKGIIWYPLEYKSGSFFIIKKVFSMLQSIFLIWKIKKKNPVRLLAAMASIAGMYGFIASRILGINYCQLTFEPHAEIVMGSGGISESGLKYKISHWFEMYVGKKSEIVVCTSRHMIDRLKELKSKAKLIRLPTCVNEEKNRFNEIERNKIRERLNLVDKKILIYPGKFGGMYGRENTIGFIAAYLKNQPQHHAIVITDFDLRTLNNWANGFGINPRQLSLLSSVKLEEIPGYLSAADIGLIAYANFEARKYCSPVKTGEYLLCGLPYIVQEATSEDDEYAIRNNVGIVAKSIDGDSYLRIEHELNEFLDQDKSSLRDRCRATGMEYRSSQLALNTLKKIFIES